MSRRLCVSALKQISHSLTRGQRQVNALRRAILAASALTDLKSEELMIDVRKLIPRIEALIKRADPT
ncbi:MAG TPA: hypothetical protein VLU47_17670, partial [Blastocatellia bacterium]|nr:hypothetical protein [Blastocatellia bacterium]